jgi:hypothetical protein
MSLSHVQERILASRREQGLPDHVTDARFLDLLAAEVVQDGGR